MNLQDLIMPFIMNNPSTKAKIESIFRQPADHVIKSFNTFIDTVNNGIGPCVSRYVLRFFRSAIFGSYGGAAYRYFSDRGRDLRDYL